MLIVQMDGYLYVCTNLQVQRWNANTLTVVTTPISFTSSQYQWPIAYVLGKGDDFLELHIYVVEAVNSDRN